jgi:hypothetical protein
MLVNLNKLKKESGDLKKYIISYAKKHNLFLDRTQVSSLELPTNKQQEDDMFAATSPNQGKAYEQLLSIYNNHNKRLFDFIRSKGMR